MQVIEVKHKQCLFDIAMQYGGSRSHVYAIAIANNISVTHLLVAGQTIVVPDSVLADIDGNVAYVLGQQRHIPASMDDGVIANGSGIGFMQIGSNFKVS